MVHLLGGVGRVDSLALFFLFLFLFFFLEEARGKPVQGCGAVEGASLLLSSLTSFPTATLNQNGFGARGSVVVFFLCFSFSFQEEEGTLCRCV